MGKKVKKKIRNTHKERRDSSGSHGTPPAQLNPPNEIVGDEGLAEKKRKTCTHIEKSVDLKKIEEEFDSNKTVRCEDCRGGALDRRESKGRGKHGKKGTGSVGTKKESKFIWVCLTCGHFACGGVGLPTTPQSHALRHSRQSRHPCVIQLENSNLCWCFPCSSLIPVGKSEQDHEQNGVLLDAVKLIKGRLSKGASIDVEDVWFGSGNVGGVTKCETSESLVLDGISGYVVRGLVNLGNTCFFNSVMQNLFAIDQFRDYFMKLDQSVGPLTMALKKLFNETSLEASSRNVISPKNLFGFICSKAPQFRGYQQQDSHELLRCLLDGLCTEELSMRKLVGPPKEDGSETTSNLGSTFVDAIFVGQLSSTVSCMECRYSSVVYEPFLDLSLPVPTRKPPSKRVPQISRPKKTKLPLKKEVKKGAKVQGKGKAVTAPVFVQSATGPSENKEFSSLVPSAAPVMEEKVASLDELSWMDYIGPDTTSNGLDSVCQNYDISAIQVSESKHVSHNDDLSQDNSEAQIQVFSSDTEHKPNSDSSKGNSYDNDLPSLLQGSEVLLLPYKEENLNTEDREEMVSKESEASLFIVDCELDSLEFDGFGDLFNEPEMVPVPNANSQENEVMETGFLAGNNSESDLDEVDDTDAPVSIDSCLAYFTKPELLSSEHAWHCENCSKILQDQQVCSGENQKISTQKELNVGQLRGQNDPLDEDLLTSTAESRSLDNGYHESDYGSTLKRDNGFLQSKYTPQKVSPSTSDCKSSNQVSSVDQANESRSVNEPDSSGSNVNQVQSIDSQSTVKECKSDDSEEVDCKCVKVMRDATKRILINKAPQILTIHLKRFSQDARGRLSKLNGHVSFQNTIDLSPYMNLRSNEKNKYDYRLIGVVEHSGTMRGGHYVAYVRGEKSRGKTKQDSEGYMWFYASDAHVREVNLAEVLQCEAYILFYEKV